MYQISPAIQSLASSKVGAGPPSSPHWRLSTRPMSGPVPTISEPHYPLESACAFCRRRFPPRAAIFMAMDAGYCSERCRDKHQSQAQHRPPTLRWIVARNEESSSEDVEAAVSSPKSVLALHRTSSMQCVIAEQESTSRTLGFSFNCGAVSVCLTSLVALAATTRVFSSAVSAGGGM